MARPVPVLASQCADLNDLALDGVAPDDGHVVRPKIAGAATSHSGY